MSLLEMTRPVQLAGEKRVHRLAGDREDAALERAPPPAPPPPEIAMPRGVYPRKAKAAKPDQPGAEAKAVTEKRKKPKAKKAKAPRVAARLASTNGHEPNFVVDDAGRIAIVDGTTRIDLTLPATKRLAIFIERTKAFRA